MHGEMIKNYKNARNIYIDIKHIKNESFRSFTSLE